MRTGVQQGLTASPKCLDSGVYEASIQCIPTPQPPPSSWGESGRDWQAPRHPPGPPSTPVAGRGRSRGGASDAGGSVRHGKKHNKPRWMQEEEDGTGYEGAGIAQHDYSYNVFDQEPRPYSSRV